MTIFLQSAPRYMPSQAISIPTFTLPHFVPTINHEASISSIAQEQGRRRQKIFPCSQSVGECEHCPAGLRRGQGMGGL